MTILDGREPDLQFFFPAPDRLVLINKDDYYLTRDSGVLYTDKGLTNKVGIIANEISYDKLSSAFTGYILIGEKGAISYAANSYSVIQQTKNLYVNQIIYGTKDFLQSKGFAVVIYDIEPLLNTTSPGNILIYLYK